MLITHNPYAESIHMQKSSPFSLPEITKNSNSLNLECVL